MRKKRLLFHTDSPLAKTGFGRAAKALLTYLYKTGKYEIHQLCCGIPHDNPSLKQVPWKAYGVNLNVNMQDPTIARNASYGAYAIDDLIQTIKPDHYIAAQDHWGVEYSIDKPWFNRVHSALWVTLDSLPILPNAVDCQKKVKNYWVWSSFAQRALHKLGHKHVETVHGPVESKHFYRLLDGERKALRDRFKIPQNAFIVGYVFRNQLRKLVPNLIKGYAFWKNQNPEIKNTYLLLHTHLSEGWDIPRLCRDYQVNPKEVLVTYVCQACGAYEVKTFDDRTDPNQPLDVQNKDCHTCHIQKSQITANVGLGVTEAQLNEIYNLMDVYVHPITSGGQEIPVIEAKYAELITLVNDYSCGEELTEEGSGSIVLDWAQAWEIGTQFEKATVYPSSIAKQINKIYHLSPEKRRKLGTQGRQWALANYPTEVIGKRLEAFIDAEPFLEDPTTWEVNPTNKCNPDAILDDISDNREWVKHCYERILDMKVADDDSGLQHWLAVLANQTPRHQVSDYFRNEARKEIQKRQNITLEHFLSKEDKKRVLLVMPRSIGDIILVSSLFESLRARYPKKEWTFYFATEPAYEDLVAGNPYIDKWIPYHQSMDNALALEGAGAHKGLFDIVYQPHFGTQRLIDYVHNGVDKIDFIHRDF